MAPRRVERGVLPRCTTEHYMHPTQVRLDAELRRALHRLAVRERTTTSVALRKALREGVRASLLREAVAGCVEARLPLGAAAELADVSIAQMATHLDSLGIPFYRYSVAGLGRDTERTKAWLARWRWTSA